MKKNIKHSFKHRDPEKILRNDSQPTQAKTEKSVENLNEIKDLKKTGILIFVFMLIVLALYLAQTKTTLLIPVLKIFGL